VLLSPTVAAVWMGGGNHPASSGLRAAEPVPTGNNWTKLPVPASEQPFARAFGAIAFDPVGGAGAVYGGRSLGGVTLSDTWVNDGDFPGYWSNFTDTVIGTPPPLTNASLVYDRADGYFVMFGGRLANGSVSGATWELLGLRHWVDVSAYQLRSPPPQAGAGMAYNEAEGTTVLLNGVGNATTWTFHAGNWSLAPSAASPVARSGEVLLYDPLDRAVLLFGGRSATGPLNDTWEFSKGAWRNLAPARLPPASAGPNAAYDPYGPGVLLYLGDQGGATWEFANGRWTPTGTGASSTPSPRVGAQLYYDSDVVHDTLFGGIGVRDGAALSDLWGWSVPPVPVDPTLSPAPLSPLELGGLAALVAVPILVAWFLRRRPPRRLPVSVPRPSSAAPFGA
jgi:hypothetical protein